MSTDTNRVRVAGVSGRVVVFEVRTEPGGGMTDFAFSRSFVLQLLCDAFDRGLEDLGDQLDRCPGPDAHTAVRARIGELQQARSTSALLSILEDLGYQAAMAAGEDEAVRWMRRHLDGILFASTLASRRNQDREELEDVYQEIEGDPDLSLEEREARLWREVHTYVVRAECADPRFLDHLHVGAEFSSCAYDLWYRDPKSKNLSRGKGRRAARGG